MFAVIVGKSCILKALYPLKLFVLFNPWTYQVLTCRVACASFLSGRVANSRQKQQSKFEFFGKFTLSAVTWCLQSCLFAQLFIMLNCQVKIKDLVLC